MTVQEWAKEFKAFINELQMPRDDYRGIIAYIEDGAKLLKAQEARVMTLDEVKGMKRLTICAVEQRSKVIKNTFNAEYGGIVTLGNENFLDFGLYADTSRYRRKEAMYGKSWRCWTSRPTDEQRETTPWEPPKEGIC